MKIFINIDIIIVYLGGRLNPEFRFEERLRQASQLLDNSQPWEALPLLQVLRDEIEASGLPVFHVSFLTAIAADGCGNFELAVDSILSAISADPVNPVFGNSRHIIGKHVFDAAMQAEDEGEILELVGMLERLGHVPVAARMREAQARLNLGDTAAARRLVHAGFILDPRGAEVQHLVAQLSTLLGGNWLVEADFALGVVSQGTPPLSAAPKRKASH